MGQALCVPTRKVREEADEDYAQLGAQPSIGCRTASKVFELKKKLGEGSWSSVYLVSRKADGKLFALKSTRTTQLSEAQRWICVNEVRLMASLRHPNLVEWHEAFLDGPWLCLVMDYLPGGDLSSAIKRHKAAGTHVPEEQVWGLLLQMVLGLQYMHQSGVAHRDLKPDNMLLTKVGELKLADLGVAGLLIGGTSACQIGTPQYMAPELHRRENYGFAADIWSLGCTLHELCTQSQVFLAATEALVERKVMAGGPVPPLPSCYSPALQELVTSMLQLDPQKRPTAVQLADDTLLQERALAGLPEEVRACLPMTQERSLAGSQVLPPIEVPASTAVFHALNNHLPTPRYSIDAEAVLGLILKANRVESYGSLAQAAAAGAISRPSSRRPSMSASAELPAAATISRPSSRRASMSTSAELPAAAAISSNPSRRGRVSTSVEFGAPDVGASPMAAAGVAAPHHHTVSSFLAAGGAAGGGGKPVGEGYVPSEVDSCRDVLDHADSWTTVGSARELSAVGAALAAAAKASPPSPSSPGAFTIAAG